MKSYRFFIANFGPFLRLAVPWSILGGLIGLLDDEFAATFANLIALTFGDTLIAITWHRAILLDEEFFPLRAFGRREWLYYLFSIIPTVLILGLSLLVVILWMSFEGKMTPAFALTFAFTGIWMVAIAPLLLIYPAIAVEERRLNLRLWFRLGGTNIVPIFVGMIVAFLPIQIIGILISPDDVGGATSWIDSAIVFGASAASALFSFAGDVTLAGFASYLYRAVKPSI